MKKDFVKLNNGQTMPLFGLGTYQISQEAFDQDIICKAITEVGIRHIDTAYYYKNEKQIGEGIQQAIKKGVKREDIFVVTKLWLDCKNNVEGYLRQQLEALQLDYVDCYLIHWPIQYHIKNNKVEPSRTPLHVVWKNMENCVKQGLTKSIGVSNFNCQLLIDLLTYCEIKPVCNQIELHPYLSQKDLVDWMLKEEIQPVAYAAIGNTNRSKELNYDIILENETIKELSKKYKKTPAQIVLRWGIQRGHVVLAKSSNLQRIKENSSIYDFVLEDQDQKKINEMNKNLRYFDTKTCKFPLNVPIFKQFITQSYNLILKNQQIQINQFYKIMSNNQCVKLNTGQQMPVIGMGCFLLDTSMDQADLVFNAITKLGVRHIDTAKIYGNEKQVGKGIRRALDTGISRKDLFVTTKLWLNQKNNVEGALRQQLMDLELQYIDLYLIHWPFQYSHHQGKVFVEKTPLHVVWKNLENCVKKGLTKAIGISNFNCQLVIDLLTYCEIKPACNQIELHPYLVQKSYVEWLKSVDIQPVAYSSMGAIGRAKEKGQDLIIEEPVVKEIAKKHGKSPAQVLLNWGIQRGHVVLNKSNKLERVKENFDAQNFKLNDEEVEKISALDKNYRFFDEESCDFPVKYPIFK